MINLDDIKFRKMRKTVLFTFIFSQTVFAQHHKEKVHEVPLASQIQPYVVPEDQLVNSALKGSKWYFDVKNYKGAELHLDKDKMKPDVLYFIDGKRFQITINQKSCKGLIKGTYQIMKINDGSTTVQNGSQPFNITSPHQKCTAELSGFLSRDLDISFNENGQDMTIKEGENTQRIMAPVN
jgi:hypothetical protein